MPDPMFDPALLRAPGDTPQDVQRHLTRELDSLDWTRSPAGHVRGHRELLEKSARS